ncbi:MAG TPA: DHH family phosphoesterase [Syntrophales bacterium]|nr:DHH family phosphoesterase [Syntrophales bacterium]HOL58299.1 DHH family phosphoesterase [Syntrophales bacterium]HPO34468.1 DHH family phosphoesterase [Syntrophales bacterium]
MRRIEDILGQKEETVFNVFRLKSMVKAGDALAILIYGSPDPDAIASAMALKELLKHLVGLTHCVIAATEPPRRVQNVLFIKAMRIDIQLVGKLNLRAFQHIAVIDAQPTFFGALLDGIQPQIVIDHHPVTTVWHAKLADVRQNYGALSTIMLEYLLAAKIRISRRLYTALLYGIKSDTNNFERDAILEDIGAYYFTFARANRELIRRIELNQIPERYLKYFEQAFSYRRRYRDRVVCYLGRVENADVCVQVADFYLRVVDIYYVVIAGIVKDKFIIVFRGDGYRRDCGSIALRAFGKFGSAGGHRSAARVEIPLESLSEVLPADFPQRPVEQFLLQRLRRRAKGLGTNGK